MSCSNCAAPLPPKSDLCRYCGTVNDRDLRQLQSYLAEQPLTERSCPHCEIQLHRMKVTICEDNVSVDRCHECLGLFLAPGSLERVVETAVAAPDQADLQRIDNLLAEEARLDSANFKYLKCPDCSNFMNRTNYGARSGVVVDSCRVHGTWLDGGELRMIFKWIHAGGQIHHQNRTADKKRFEAYQARQKRLNDVQNGHTGSANNGTIVGLGDASMNRDDVILDSVLGALAAIILE